MKKIILILLALSLSACNGKAKMQAQFDSERNKFYKEFTENKISGNRSILVVPPVNNSANVKASGDFLSSIAFPIAERGYYVFPVNLVKKVMELEGMSDAHLVHHASSQTLSEMFGADAILYTTINRWDAKYVGISTIITVDLTYVLKSGRDGSILWKDTQSAVYDSNQNLGSSGSLPELIIKLIINSLVSKATEEGKYFPLVQQANNTSISQGPHHIPSGMYLVEYEKQMALELAKKAEKKASKK